MPLLHAGARWRSRMVTVNLLAAYNSAAHQEASVGGPGEPCRGGGEPKALRHAQGPRSLPCFGSGYGSTWNEGFLAAYGVCSAPWIQRVVVTTALLLGFRWRSGPGATFHMKPDASR